MTRLRTGLAGVILFAALTAAVHAGESAREIFERARLLEENARTLDRAVVLYEKVVTEAKGDRALAGAAELQIAIVKERQGKPEARAAFAKVAKDYADQPEIAARARARLAGSGAARHAAPGTPRQVFSDASYWAAAVSSDGRLTVGPGGHLGRSVVVRDLSTSETRTLLAATDMTGAVAIALSADASRIALQWREFRPSQQPLTSLKVSSTIDGSAVRTLLPNDDSRVPSPQAWSPDGRSILTLLRDWKTNTATLGWVAADTGAITPIKKFDPPPARQPSGIALSPDGAFIAYVMADGPVNGVGRTLAESRIYVMDRTGGNETQIVNIAATNRNPIWTPDGERVLFASNRTGVFALWSVGVRGGAAVGEPALVRSPFEGTLVSMTRSGDLYYTQVQLPRQFAFVAERAIPGTRPAQSFSGEGVSWAPDGSSLAFIKNDGTDRNNSLIIRSLASGDERMFEHPSRLNVQQVRWSGDGKSILVNINPSSRLTANLHIFDAKTQTFRQVPASAEPGHYRGVVGDMSPDGSTIYTIGRDAPQSPASVVLAVDVATGAQRVLTPLEGQTAVSPAIAVSPDGQMLAVQSTRSGRGTYLTVMRTDGTGVKDLYGPFYTRYVASTIAWTPDSAGVLFFVPHAEGSWQLMRAPVAAGPPVVDGLQSASLVADKSLPSLAANSPLSLTVSPDGSRVAFGAYAAGSQDLWAIDNLLLVVNGMR
jgi:Tol biopolymer transport system component